MARWRAKIAVGLGIAASAVASADDGWRPLRPSIPPVLEVSPAVPASTPTVTEQKPADERGLVFVDGPPAPAPSKPDADAVEFHPAKALLKGMEPEPLPPPRPTTEAPPKPAAAPASPTKTPEAAPLLEPLPSGHIAPAGSTAIPMRHGAFGSRNLTLSRDYHFLDLFGASLVADDGVVLADGTLMAKSFVQAEYLMWWVRSANIPVLASTGTGQSFGYLGQPGTQPLLGPGTFGSTARNGFRVRAGTWFDGHLPGYGIDSSFFYLGKQSSSATISSNQFPTIARPFFAPNLNQEFAELVTFPGLSTGALQVDSQSELWGADVNLRKCICRTCGSSSEWFVGFRNLNLRESLTITEFITAGPTAPDPVGTQIVVQDKFGTRNSFYGPQVGYAIGRQRGQVSVDGRASLAMGVTHQEIDNSAFQQRTRPGETPQVFTGGGLLVAGPNFGKFTRNEFSVVPEVTLNVGYQVTSNFRTYVGYNFLYWSNVIRPGDQIDRVVDLTFVPNAPAVPFSGQFRPQPLFRQTDLWVQGVQFGMEWRW